jgi:hypothetical protein
MAEGRWQKGKILSSSLKKAEGRGQKGREERYLFHLWL